MLTGEAVAPTNGVRTTGGNGGGQSGHRPRIAAAASRGRRPKQAAQYRVQRRRPHHTGRQRQRRESESLGLAPAVGKSKGRPRVARQRDVGLVFRQPFAGVSARAAPRHWHPPRGVREGVAHDFALHRGCGVAAH